MRILPPLSASHPSSTASTTKRIRPRHSSRSRAVALGLLSLLVLLSVSGCGTTSYIWDFTTVQPFVPTLIDGVQNTLVLTAIVILISMPLGVFVAAARLSPFRPVRFVATVYVEIMRGTPTLVLLFWVYYVTPVLFGVNFSAFTAGVVGLCANVTAFYGEAFRSGIQSIPKVENEAGDILGFGFVHRLRYITVPQAFRAVLPVLISLSVTLFKDTSLVSTLGVTELMYQGQQVATTTYRPMEVFTTVAVIYLVVAIPVTLLARRLEIYMRRHLRT